MPRPLKKLPLEFILKVYDAFLREYELTKVAAALDKDYKNFLQLMDKYPELQIAKRQGEARRKQDTQFTEYVFRHLSPPAKEKWNELQFWEGNETATNKVQSILQAIPTKVRQELFVHAMVMNGWNPSEACRITATPYQTYNKWCTSDLSFHQMIEEIEWHKKNWFESALNDLVGMRDVSAVLFVNRTKNRDRGYNDKVQIEHTGTIQHQHLHVADLDLPLEVRKVLLEAVRKRKVAMGQVVEVEEVKALPAPEVI